MTQKHSTKTVRFGLAKAFGKLAEWRLNRKLRRKVCLERVALIEALEWKRRIGRAVSDRNYDLSELSPDAKKFIAQYGLARVEELFDTVDTLASHMLSIRPPRTPGMGVGTEAALALEILEKQIPGIPEEIKSYLSGIYCFDNR